MSGEQSDTDLVQGAGTRTALRLFPEPRLIEGGHRMRGVKAGAIVLAGVAAANAGNAVFHLIAGRWLGPSEYADLASLLALLGLLSFPLGAVQIALAQRIAYFAARRDLAGVRTLYRSALAAAFAVGVLLAGMMGLAATLIGRALDVDSTLAVVVTAACLVPAAVAPVVAGLAQGLERFVLFAATQSGGPLLRILWLFPVMAVGAGVSGAVSATFVASLLMLLVPMWMLAGWLRRGGAQDRIGALRQFSTDLLPAVVGILAFTSLTTFDVIVAKLAFSDHDAGIYSGASIVGRLILYVPAAIVAVLLPKVAARVARGARTSDILTGSLAVTALFCVAATAVYAIAPELILDLSFGSDYAEADELLWLFGVAMTGFALVNVLFIYDLGRGRARMSWILGAAALVQLALFALLHSSPRALLLADIVVAYPLLLVARLSTRSEAG